MSKYSIYDWVLIGVFAALTGIGAYLKVFITPELPITLQTLIVIMAGLLLGPGKALLSQVVYLLLGLIGLPIFAQGVVGIAYVVQPSFGFILGFIFGAFLTGLMERGLKKWPMILRTVVASLAGMVGIYALGVPYMYLIKSFYGNNVAFLLIAAGMIPFALADLVKIVLAVLIRPALQSALGERN